MRLIDADSLIHLVTDSTILGDGFKTAFCALVNGEPTVKVQKTGKWIEKGRSLGIPESVCYTCSECGNAWWNVKGDWKFCPKCGADMRGEEE